MCCSFRFFISGFLMAVLCTKDCLGLRDVKIKVPQAVIRGRDAELQCYFDLEGEKLYSVKWYRGQAEFFRYTPNAPVPVMVFPLKGIKVRDGDLGDAKIVLENVSREISGPFSCEVTAERPSFFTVMQTAQLQVIDPPVTEPYITGLKKRYSPEDETFHANCTSEHSYPAANITWYINGLQIRGPQVMKHTINYGSRFTVVSSIRHRLLKKLFPGGRMKLRCSANLYNAYHNSIEVSVELSERRRKNHHHPDWPPTTRAPPPLIIEDDEDYNKAEDDDNNSSEDSSSIKLWFWSPSTATSCSSLTVVLMVLSQLFINNGMLFR